ncbi:MAG: MarR family transcriptional regulator [Myxococcales bacterium]|nr:MarR family transcriptional regulator [Myxococcales bacterium]
MTPPPVTQLKAPRVGLAYLLSQIGAHAADEFGQRLKPLELTTQHVGILRLLAMKPVELTQRKLAEHLRIQPSRLVLLLDELERKGLVARHTDPEDRRAKRLAATEPGLDRFRAVEALTRDLEAELFEDLSRDERAALAGLLRRVAAKADLIPGVHPAYRRLAKKEK